MKKIILLFMLSVFSFFLTAQSFSLDAYLDDFYEIDNFRVYENKYDLYKEYGVLKNIGKKLQLSAYKNYVLYYDTEWFSKNYQKENIQDLIEDKVDFIKNSTSTYFEATHELKFVKNNIEWVFIGGDLSMAFSDTNVINIPKFFVLKNGELDLNYSKDFSDLVGFMVFITPQFFKELLSGKKELKGIKKEIADESITFQNGEVFLNATSFRRVIHSKITKKADLNGIIKSTQFTSSSFNYLE